jgi:hypothetical protein
MERLLLAKWNHLDVKVANVTLSADNKSTLVDFDVSTQKEYNVVPAFYFRILSADMIVGMDLVHEARWRHGDMKAENVMVCTGPAARPLCAKFPGQARLGGRCIKPTRPEAHPTQPAQRFSTPPNSCSIRVQLRAR